MERLRVRSQPASPGRTRTIPYPTRFDVSPTHATSCTGTAISTAAQLQAINNNLSGSFCLVNNLDLSGAVFTPIGTSAQPFTGSFDGQGYTISNLTIYLPGNSEVGLFGATDGATVTNIGLQNVAVYGGNFQVGGLVGYQQGGSISQAYSTGSVSGNSEVGGLVGFENGGGISQAYSASSVSGSVEVGGLVGYQVIGNISQAYSTGSVSGNDEVGGLVGAQDGNISLAYSDSSVTGSTTVGGLVGEQYGGSTGQAYSTGSVTGSTTVGGLVGHLVSFGASSSFWDTTTSGQSTSAAGTPESDSGMKMMATFTGAGWDFRPATGVRSIVEGTSYPYLQALGSTVEPPTSTPTPTNTPTGTASRTSTPTTPPTNTATSTPTATSSPISLVTSTTIILTAGWNLVALPLAPTSPLSASTVLAQVLAASQGATPKLMPRRTGSSCRACMTIQATVWALAAPTLPCNSVRATPCTRTSRAGSPLRVHLRKQQRDTWSRAGT